MLESKRYVENIIEKLNVFSSEMQAKSKLNLNDECVHAENFVCELLNICYDYELHNLNELKANFPGIDLGDEKKKIGIQVTIQSTSKKINTTLKKCYESKCYETFSNLKFFILSKKQTSYTISKNYEEIKFNYKQDILDFSSLYSKIQNLNIDKQKRMSEYIDKQLPNVYKTFKLGNEKEISDDIQENIQQMLEKMISAKNNDNEVLLNDLLESSLNIIKNNINNGYISKANDFISRIFLCGINGINENNLIELYYYKAIVNINLNEFKEVEICRKNIENKNKESLFLKRLNIKIQLKKDGTKTIDNFRKDISKYLIKEDDLLELEIEYLVIHERFNEVIDKYNTLENDGENINYLLSIAYLNSDMFEEALTCINKAISKNDRVKYTLIKEQSIVFKIINFIKNNFYVTEKDVKLLKKSYHRLNNMNNQMDGIDIRIKESYYCTILNCLLFSKDKSFEEFYSKIPDELKSKYNIKSILALFYSTEKRWLDVIQAYDELYKKYKLINDLICLFQGLLEIKDYQKIISRFMTLNKEEYDDNGIIVSIYLSALIKQNKNIDNEIGIFDKMYEGRSFYYIHILEACKENSDLKIKYFRLLKNNLGESNFLINRAIQIAQDMNLINDKIEILEKYKSASYEMKKMLLESYLQINDEESLKKAKELIDEELKQTKSDYDMYLIKAQIEYGLNDFRESLKYYKFAFEINNNEFIASNIVSLMLEAENKTDLEKYCRYIMNKSQRSDLLMIAAMGYELLRNSRIADELSFKSLYLQGNKDDKQLMQQYIGMQTRRIQNTVTDKINEFECIDEDCICILSNKSNDETVNICINSQEIYESGENKIFNAKHICMNNAYAIELIGLKVNDELEINGTIYVVKNIIDKYLYVFNYITQRYTKLYPKSKFFRAFEWTTPESFKNVLKSLNDEFGKNKNNIDLYKFDDKNIGIPLDMLTRGEFSQYINVIYFLLNSNNKILYAGERNRDIDLKSYNKIIPTLSTIVILYELGKLNLLDNIREKVVIPKSLCEQVFNCYKQLTIMKKRGTLRVFFEENTDKYILTDSNINDVDKKWKDIYEYIKTLTIEDVSELTLDEVTSKLSLFCNICQCESIVLCKKYNGILLCDDLFLRRVSNAINVINTNIVSLVDVNTDKESISFLLELSDKNYNCYSLPFDIMERRASLKDKNQALLNLINNEIKKKVYSPIINYIIEFRKNLKVGCIIKNEKLCLTIDYEK